MGEIKSTLDLIMEKTKNLSLTPEEKEEIRRQDWLKKARGWIQKFLDDLIDMDRVKGELLNKEPPSGWEKILKKELIDGLEPEADNEKRFQLIKELLGISPKGFIKILEGHHQRLDLERDKRMASIKSQLSKPGHFRRGRHSQPGGRSRLENLLRTGHEKLQRRNDRPLKIIEPVVFNHPKIILHFLLTFDHLPMPAEQVFNV